MKRKKLEFEIDDNGCFIITSHRINGDGYGYMYWDRKEQRIHRFVYEQCFGQLPIDLVVRHKCDNRSCINPEHLESGTLKDNVLDAVERKRNAFGGRNGNAKISESQALEIKRMLQKGVSVRQIMEQLNLSRKIVRSIKEGKTWRHVS